MEHQIKVLAEATASSKLKDLIINHVTLITFVNNHITLYLDNAGPLHEFQEKEMDKHLKDALEKLYPTDATYEVKFQKGTQHEREKEQARNIHTNH